METTLPLPFLVSIGSPNGQATNDGLTRQEIALLGVPFYETASKDWGRPSAGTNAHMDATSLSNPDDVIALLDGGVRTVFVASESYSEYTEYGARVIPTVSSLDISTASENGLFVKDFDISSSDVDKFVEEASAKKIKILYIKPAPKTDIEKFIEIAKKANAIPIIPSTGLTTDKNDSSRLLLSKIIASYWKSDRSDGLIPTVVTDDAGIALGLAYTSEESILEALRTQTGVYQSRKRGLWVKGLTSGDTQELLRIGLDCDNDT